MADKKISQLNNASTPLVGNEVLPIVQNGDTVKVSINNVTADRNVAVQGLVVTTGNIEVGGDVSGPIPALTRRVSVQSTVNNSVVGYAMSIADGVNNRRCSMFLDDTNGVFGWDATATTGVPFYMWRWAGAELARLEFNQFTTRVASVFNEDGGDFDFRVEGDTDPNLLFIDASADKVGVGGGPAAFDKFTVTSVGVGVGVNSTSGAGGINFYESGIGRFSLRTLNGSAGLSFYDSLNTVERAKINAAGSFLIGAAAVATTATDGFLYIPTCAGTPTGTPSAVTGLAPLVIDSTNNKLYFYSGGQWRDAGP